MKYHLANDNREEGDVFRWDIRRYDPLLVECVETLGDDANLRRADGRYWSKLKVVEVPADIKWHIGGSCNYELISDDRVWGK